MSDEENGPVAPAGWYPMPGGGQRYWDGAAWTNLPEPEATTRPDERRSKRRTRAIVAIVSILVALAIAAGGIGVAWKMNAEAEARAAAEQAAAEQASKTAEERARKEARAEEAAMEAERARRSSSVEEIEAAVERMAKGHADDDLIDDAPISVSCSPVSGGSLDDLTERTTVFSCFVATEDNGDGTFSGYTYNATMNWDTGEYTYGYGAP